ncbi:hypothetical protein ALT785_240031 [Alteromonas infernus]
MAALTETLLWLGRDENASLPESRVDVTAITHTLNNNADDCHRRCCVVS